MFSQTLRIIFVFCEKKKKKTLKFTYIFCKKKKVAMVASAKSAQEGGGGGGRGEDFLKVAKPLFVCLQIKHTIKTRYTKY